MHSKKCIMRFLKNTFLHIANMGLSISQANSALCSSSLKHLSSVCRCHSFSEAVLFFSVSFLRLICPEHYKCTSPIFI